MVHTRRWCKYVFSHCSPQRLAYVKMHRSSLFVWVKGRSFPHHGSCTVRKFHYTPKSDRRSHATLPLGTENIITQCKCRGMTGRAIHGAYVDERPGFPTICGDHSRRFNQTLFGSSHQSRQETAHTALNLAGVCLESSLKKFPQIVISGEERIDPLMTSKQWALPGRDIKWQPTV
jgi:hypothetical protein